MSSEIPSHSFWRRKSTGFLWKVIAVRIGPRGTHEDFIRVELYQRGCCAMEQEVHERWEFLEKFEPAFESAP